MQLRIELEEELLKGLGVTMRTALQRALDKIFSDAGEAPLTSAKAKEMLNEHFPSGIGGVKADLKSTALERIERVQLELERIARSPDVQTSAKMLTDTKSIISDINSRKNPSLFVVSAFRP